MNEPKNIPVSKIPDSIIEYIFNDEIEKPVVKVSWSGGKDSTCAVIQHTLAKHKCEIVTYVPELISGLPLIGKAHKDFIYETALLFRSWGHNVHILHGISYYDLFHQTITRGKNKGKLKGYSLGFGYCKFRDESKIKTLNNFKCNFDYEDIGIAYDEVKRQNQLTNLKRSILVENHITEDIARYICKKYGALSPHYEHNTRDGCVICPNCKPDEFYRYLKDYPQAKRILMDLDREYIELQIINGVKDNNGKPIAPYRNYETFTDQILKGEYENAF